MRCPPRPRCLIQIMTEVVHLGLVLALGSLDGLVGAGLLGQSLVGIGQLLLDHPSVPVGLLQQGAGLLQGVLVGVDSSIGGDEGILGSGLGSDLVLILGLDLANNGLDPLDVPLALGVRSICVLKSNTKIDCVSLQLLLHPESLDLTLGLALKLHLHTVKGLHEVLLGGGKLLVLLSQAALDLLPDLGELQGGSQHLVLLLLQGTLSLGKGSLKLHLLSLEPLPNFVNLVDGAASLGDLVEDVLNLVGQGPVLPSDLVQLKHGLVIGVLHLEQLRGDAAGLILSSVQVHGKTVNLGLPLADNPVALLGLLLHVGVEDLGLVQLDGHLLSVSLKLGLVLLQLGQLHLQLVDHVLGLGEPGLELELGHGELLGLGHTVNLILLSPHVGIALGLGHLAGDVLLGTNLLVEGLLETIKLVFEVPVLSKKRDPLLGLVVS